MDQTQQVLLQELNTIDPEIDNLVQEYTALFQLPQLTDQQADRLSEILMLAAHNKQLDFWIAYTTCQQGKQLGLGSQSILQAYENQKALLREYLLLDSGEMETDNCLVHLRENLMLGVATVQNSTSTSKDRLEDNPELQHARTLWRALHSKRQAKGKGSLYLGCKKNRSNPSTFHKSERPLHHLT